MRHPWKLPLAVVCLLALAFAPLLPAPRGSAQAVNYAATDLGTLGGAQSTALGLDECGKVVGESNPAGSGFFHPYFWDGATMTDLGTFGGQNGGASAVNGVGRVAGFAQTATSEQRPFVWTQAAGKSDLSAAGTGAAAYDINDSNQVVGQWETSPLQDRAFVWTQATGMQIVTAPWGTPIAAYGINNAGHIVGTAQTSGGASHAFLSSGGVVTDLGTLGGTNSFAYDLNESGVVVGHANIPSSNASRPFHAFRWTSARGMQDLGTLGGARSIAYGVNASGQIVGYAEVSPGVNHAFLWADANANGAHDAGEMKDLNTLAPTAGWTYEEARAVNDRGQIVVTAVNGSGQRRAFRLTPDNAGPSPCAVFGSLQFSAATYAVGEAGTNATVTVTRTGGSDEAVSVGYATSNGTATAGSDYAAASGTLNFADGETSKTFNVAVSDDALDEADETVNLTLSGPAGGATLGTQTTAVLTITDNDATPALSIGDPAAAVAEGNAGPVNAVFNVTLSAASAQTVTVNYATADNSATQPGDYASASGTLTFNPGDTVKTVTVAVAGDTTDEPNETFFVNLSSPSNATVSDGQGVGTITDDDGAPSLSVGDATPVAEGNAGTTAVTFNVTLLPASGQTVTVNYATANGTATAGSDYTAAGGTLTFTPGDTSETVTVNVTGDAAGEAHETFLLNLSSPTNATISDNQAQATVNNDDAALSINDVSNITEGNSGQVDVSFNVSLSHASINPVSVNYATSNGTAAQPDDYTAANGTLNFAAGDTSKTVTVTVKGETTFETNETFNVALSSATGGATISVSTGVGTITNDDTAPAFSISDVTLAEGNSNTTAFNFTVTLSAPSGVAASVNYATTSSGGTATVGNDYATKSGTLNFAPGDTSKIVTVDVTGDRIFENDETFFVNLSSPSGATISDAQGLGTITNDEASSTIEFANVHYTVGEGGTFTFHVTRAGDLSAGGVTVNYQTASGGTATSGSDYTPISGGTLTFGPGESQKEFTLTPALDGLDEPTEDVALTLSSPFGGTLGARHTVALNITDVDPPPTFSINNVNVTEGGNGGIVNAEFTVTLSAPSGFATSVDYATANHGTLDVSATAGSDYTSRNGTLNFAPGVTEQKLTVPVNGDRIFENDETFAVNLSGATNAGLGDGQGVGTINNDEEGSVVQFSHAAYTVGEAGGTVTITLVRTSGTAGGVTAGGQTEPGTATSPQSGNTDYTTRSFRETFAEGETQKTFTVSITNDTLDEPDETFNVKLNDAPLDRFGATFGAQKTATVTINDDDAPPAFRFSAATYEVNENVPGGQIVITVTRTGGTNGGVSVKYATSNGTATAGSDYAAAGGTLNFADGETSKTFNVAVSDDTLDEADETVNLTLSDPSGGATLGAQATAVLNVRDDEGVPSLSVGDVTLTEGSAGDVNAVFDVTLSGASGQTVTVNYETADGTATFFSLDYVMTNGALTFNPGETAKTVTVRVVGDTADEPDENFFLRLSGAGNAIVSDPEGVGTIVNDDDPRFGFAQFNFDADESAHFVTVTVTRSGDAAAAANVDFATSDGTAIERKDYTAVSGTLRFAAGETSKTFDVLLTEDAFNEGLETINLTLSNPTGGAGLGPQETALVSISADDSNQPQPNTIDDSINFVRQHYHDFLNREPDASGLAFWVGGIESCGADAACREVKRINTSAAFFLSIEFQETGYLVYRTFKTAYGDATSPGVPGTVPAVRLSEFLPDTRRIGEGVVVGPPGWEATLEANKNAYTLEFVSRQRFADAYPATLTPAAFVDALFANAGVTPAAADRQAAIGEFGAAATSADAAARARSLRRVAEHPALVQAEFRRAFVLMQYYGYLRRNPDDAPEPGLNFGGWNFWLGKLNEFGGDAVRAEMVKAFLDSAEYRNRFGN